MTIYDDRRRGCVPYSDPLLTPSHLFSRDFPSVGQVVSGIHSHQVVSSLTSLKGLLTLVKSDFVPQPQSLKRINASGSGGQPLAFLHPSIMVGARLTTHGSTVIEGRHLLRFLDNLRNFDFTTQLQLNASNPCMGLSGPGKKVTMVPMAPLVDDVCSISRQVWHLEDQTSGYRRRQSSGRGSFLPRVVSSE